jgi:hypothetical protein
MYSEQIINVQDYKFHVFPFAGNYTLELITLTVENLVIFVTNSEVHAVKKRYRHYPHTTVLHTYMITFWLSYAYDLLGILYDVSSYMFHKYIVFWSTLPCVHFTLDFSYILLTSVYGMHL